MKRTREIAGGLLGIWLLAVASVGNAADPPKATLTLYGMTCQICEYALEKNLKRMKEVQKARADLIEGWADVVFHPGKSIDPARLSRVVNDSGITLKAIALTAEGLLNRKAGRWFFKIGDADQTLPVQENGQLAQFKGLSPSEAIKLRMTGRLVTSKNGSGLLLVVEGIEP